MLLGRPESYLFWPPLCHNDDVISVSTFSSMTFMERVIFYGLADGQIIVASVSALKMIYRSTWRYYIRQFLTVTPFL